MIYQAQDSFEELFIRKIVKPALEKAEIEMWSEYDLWLNEYMHEQKEEYILGNI